MKLKTTLFGNVYQFKDVKEVLAKANELRSEVAIVDDLIATGGTIEAAIKLVEELGGEVVKVVFLMELAGLKGREKLAGYDVASVIKYDGK